ncbi:hypothetical protein Lalb_Chr16g0387921 [Lupinus albus]|uniref:Uncharacterized protein n=1 Tax=Lupinus albus TaxID=3870 RepID=A0A6A4PBS7_LUPAL|nr:hypothetical protein Lalb_Chr16g0387921 [Lupinus albus]
MFTFLSILMLQVTIKLIILFLILMDCYVFNKSILFNIYTSILFTTYHHPLI